MVLRDRINVLINLINKKNALVYVNIAVQPYIFLCITTYVRLHCIIYNSHRPRYYKLTRFIYTFIYTITGSPTDQGFQQEKTLGTIEREL